MVGNLRDILTFAGVVTAHRVFLHHGQLVALTQRQGSCVVKHVCLDKSSVTFIDSLDRHVGLGQPGALDIDALLRISVLDQVLTLKVREYLSALLIQRPHLATSHP